MPDPNIVRTKSYVVMSRGVADEIVDQRRRYGLLAKQLSARLEEEQQLLQIALHELSVKRGVVERERFARQWLAKHRKLDLQGVPIERP